MGWRVGRWTLDDAAAAADDAAAGGGGGGAPGRSAQHDRHRNAGPKHGGGCRGQRGCMVNRTVRAQPLLGQGGAAAPAALQSQHSLWSQTW
eukprot:gene1438-156_t